MNASTTGLLIGLLLALVVVVGGLLGLLLALVLGAAGYLAGAHVEGRVDLQELVRGRRG